jgi:type VI secretion system secreted protein VgrG
MVTPQSASFNAGSTTSIAAGQDINLIAGANAAHSVKSGISLFTYGKASNPKKPNQETGIQLHAASGKVSSQSQSDKTQITADKSIAVNSTHDAITIQAPKHVLLTAQSAYIKMSGGNIEVHAPGRVDFKATMKSWTSAKSDKPAPLELAKIQLHTEPIKNEQYIQELDISTLKGSFLGAINLSGEGYRIKSSDDKVLYQASLNAGVSKTIVTQASEKIRFEIGSGDWEIEQDGFDHGE